MNSENRLLISVVMPTYNRAGLVSRAINSVLAQTYSNWELIIVDDGSTDNTEDVVKTFLYDNRVKYIKKENSGAAHSRNIGIDKSIGEWVTFLDSDDELLDCALMLVASQELTSIDVVSGYSITIHENGKHHLNRGVHVKELNVKVSWLAGSMFIRSTYISSNKMQYDNNLQSNQHLDLFLSMFTEYNRPRILNLKEALVKVYKGSNLSIRLNYESLINGTTLLIKKHHDLFKKGKTIHIHYRQLSRYYSLYGSKVNAVKYGLLSIRWCFFDKKSYYNLIKVGLR